MGALFTLVGDKMTLAPGQTDVYLEAEASPTGWPDPNSIQVSFIGLPQGITATWVQNQGFIPPAAGVTGAAIFSASPSVKDQQAVVTVRASSGNVSFPATLDLTIAGVCHPITCAGLCGSVPDGCSGSLSCPGCPKGMHCEPNHTCGSPNKCPKGTHDCGNGVCTRFACQ